MSKKVKNTLYDFQVEGVVHIEKNKGRALIADDPGLGKTVQAICWVRMHKEIRKILVISPSSLKINWQREMEKWMRSGYTYEILEGQKPYIVQADVAIINYDILRYWEEELLLTEFDLIIADEVQYIKNQKAKRTTSFNKIVKHSPYLISLTGTPIENKPQDIYNIIHTIDASIFPNYYKFIYGFCGAKKGRFGIEYKQDKVKAEKLHKVLTSSVMIRRKKEDVLKELPSKNIIKVPVPINNKKEYKKAEDEFIRYVAEKFTKDLKALNDKLTEETKHIARANNIEVNATLSKRKIKKLVREKVERVANAPTLAKIETLKQVAVKGKMDSVEDWIKDFIDSGEKLVVFGIHRKVINQLHERFEKIAVRVDGSVKGKKRQKAVDEFQNNPKIKLFIGNVQAAGVGLTLTSASTALFVQFPWNPGQLTQAEDRIHRISQIHQVSIWRMVAENTIEERIIDILNNKQKMISKIIDGEDIAESSVIVSLINSYQKKVKKEVIKSYKAGSKVSFDL